MLMFYNTRIQSLCIRIIDNSDTLIVLYREPLIFKAEAAIFQTTITGVKILINTSCKNDFRCQSFEFISIMKEIYIHTHIDALKHTPNKSSIALTRNPLKRIIKIIVVKG